MSEGSLIEGRYRFFAFISYIIAFLLFATVAPAQTQQGVVKTRGRMVNGVLQKGKPLAGATVQVKDRQAMVSGNGGKFSFPVRENTFLLQSVKKNGYQLVDQEACRSYQYSANPLYVIMDTPEQQQADLLAAERKIRRNLQRQLQEREDEIETLQASQQEKDSLLRVLYQQQGDNEKLISDMAKRYSALDYDQLDEFYRQVSWFIENGELTRADSLLHTRGDINAQVQGIINQGKAIQEQKEQLQKAEKVHQADIDEAARRCYSYYETHFARHQNDSAAYYLELRAALDTTNVLWTSNAGSFIAEYMANYSKALEYYEKALAIGEKVYGKEHPYVISCYSNIGSTYENQGDYTKAIEFHEKALAIGEKVLGTEHPDMAKSYNNIGLTYNSLGDNTKALEYYEKALAIGEKVLGTEHPIIASIYNNIGFTYKSQDDYTKAIESYEKALAIGEKVLGTEHPDMATFYNNIGLAYDHQKEYRKALGYYEKSLTIYKKVYGEEHPRVANSYQNIGCLYFLWGNKYKALDYLKSALAIFEKVLGEEHPDVARCYINLAIVYEHDYQPITAIEYLEKALTIREKVYGKEHPYVADLCFDVGSVYYTHMIHLNHYKALEYLIRALTIREKIYGNEHSAVAESYENVGMVYNARGDYLNALEHYEKALTIYEKVYGADHSSTISIKKKVEEVRLKIAARQK